MAGAMTVAERVATRLGAIPGVVAVALGGSWARGAAQAGSDVDLGLYYRPDRRPALAALNRLAEALDDRRPTAAVTEFGAWGPWIDGGAWLTIEGQRVDWLFRDLDRVAEVLADCRAGRIACAYQPGHPHGFHAHIYAGEVYHARPLHDPDGALAAAQRLTAEYPPALREALVRQYLWEARFALETTAKAAARGDVLHVAGSLFRAVACLVQVLFALNERWFVNEKGAGGAVAAMPQRPAGFARTVARLLGHPGATPAALEATLGRGLALLAAVERLAAEAGLPYAVDRAAP